VKALEIEQEEFLKKLKLFNKSGGTSEKI
jgi:hypothetical protein